jgi:hypothetical protein
MKRSSQVALLLMGTMAVGGGAYAVMPHENNCQPGVVQPDGKLSQESPNCNRSSRGSSSGGYHYYSGSSSSSSSASSRQSYFSSDGRTNLGSSTGGDHSSSSSSSVSRGGFGSFAAHFSGGG